MLETLMHKEVFELYYVMGHKRSLFNLREKLLSPDCPLDAPNLKTLKRWSKAFNWQEQLELRDIENAKKLTAKTDSTIISEKAKCRKDIIAFVNILKYSANVIIEQIKQENKKPSRDRNPIFQVSDIQDFDKLVKGYDTLQKLNFLVLGEPTGATDQTPILVINMPENKEDNGGNGKEAIEAQRYKVQEKEGDLNELT